MRILQSIEPTERKTAANTIGELHKGRDWYDEIQKCLTAAKQYLKLNYKVYLLITDVTKITSKNS